jgi:hypothetical protein
MMKKTRGKAPEAANQNEVHQPVVGDAEPRRPNLIDLAKTFAPVIELRAVKDLKVNRRNARSHSPRQVQQTRSWPATVACVQRCTLIWRRYRPSRSST